MKSKICLSALAIVLLGFCLGANTVSAADDAVFSFVPDKTSYAVGDDVKVNYMVDVGQYTTLSVIDFSVKISDTTIIAPKSSGFFSPGDIYSQLGASSITDSNVNALVYIDPNNKTAGRSGRVGTFTFTALKAGAVTLSSDKIEATQESSETDWAITSSSQGKITVGSSSSSSGVATSNLTGASANTTATVKGSTTKSVQTGPSGAIALSLAAGFAIYLVLIQCIINKNARKYEP
jgi:hypothetical protein